MRKTGCAVQYQGITLRTVQLGRMYSSLASPVFVLDLARMRPSFGLTTNQSPPAFISLFALQFNFTSVTIKVLVIVDANHQILNSFSKYT